MSATLAGFPQSDIENFLDPFCHNEIVFFFAWFSFLFQQFLPFSFPTMNRLQIRCDAAFWCDKP